MVSWMAAQAEEGSRLKKHALIHGTVGIVTYRAVLSDRRMFEYEWPLFFGVALVADQVDQFLLQVALGLSMRVMAAGASDFAFR